MVPKSQLLATKFHRPPLPPRWVERPQLRQRLNEGLARQRPLTLVSAPAGFGKTSCVSQWVNGLESRPVAWLSLDPADDDPARFFAYIVAALQQIKPDFCRELAGVLRAGQLPPGEVIGAALINGLLALDRQALLALDDLHVIQDGFILEVLQQLVANLPGTLHLVLITREDPPLPLARLRANNQLTEIRARDLRFRQGESDRFLNEVMALTLSQADVALLEEKTEGWIAGLQLAAIAMQGSPLPEQRDRSAFIATLSGSHRFILSYLTEQVVDRQPAAIRHFLLQTSILDRLNVPLCNAITGRNDSQELLERLLSANLFLISLDNAGHWYRYHHLFADLLRNLQATLPQERVTALHRRASQWYAAEAGRRPGERSAFVGEAIRHALAAADYAHLTELLEAHAMEMVMEGHARAVNGWVEALPAAWQAQSPRTELALAWMHLLRGAYAQASPYLERVEATLVDGYRGEAQAALRAEWLVMRSLVRQMEADRAAGEALARRALALAPQADARVQSLASFALANALRLHEQGAAAVDSYRTAVQRAREAENPLAEMLSTVGLTTMAFEQGQLHLAQEIAEPAIARIERSGSLPPIGGVLYGILGDVHYQWYRLEEAAYYSQRALHLSTLGGYNSGQVVCRVLLCRLALAARDTDAAADQLAQVADLVPGPLPAYVRHELVAEQVRVYLARQLPAAAQLALTGEGFAFADTFAFPPFPPENANLHSAGLLYNSSLRLLLYQARTAGAQASLNRGIGLADQLLAHVRQREYLLVVLEALLLRAQMQVARDGEGSEGGARDYVRALHLAEPEGIVAVFVEQGPPVAEALEKLAAQKRLDGVCPEYVQRLIALGQAQPQPPWASPPRRPERLVEPLSARELEVLQLIAEGLKYKEIAATLFISLNTVRFHVKAIYGKLGVNKRGQAVARARQLQIL